MYGYHVASPDDRDSISTHGLDATTYAEEASGNWLWLDLGAARRFGGPDSDIWEVTLDGLDVSYEPLIYAHAVRTAANVMDTIPPNRVTLVTPRP